MCEFLATILKIIPVLGLDCILDGAGNGVLGAQNMILTEFDLTRSITLKTAAAAAGARALGPLPPGLCGACLAARRHRNRGIRLVVGTFRAITVLRVWLVMGRWWSVAFSQRIGRVWSIILCRIDCCSVVKGTAALASASRVLVEQRALDLFIIGGIVVGTRVRLKNELATRQLDRRNGWSYEPGQEAYRAYRSLREVGGP